jgi:two-component sensor histidine kinase
VPGPWQSPEIQALLRDAIAGVEPTRDVDVPFAPGDAVGRTARVSVRALGRGADHTILMGIEAMTERRLADPLVLAQRLLQAQAEGATDGYARAALDAAAARTGVLSAIQGWIDRNAETASRIDIAACLNDVSRAVTAAAGVAEDSWRIVVDPTPLTLPPERAVPLNLLVTELLAEMVRHAGPDAPHGRLQVGFATEDGGQAVRITVAGSAELPASVQQSGVIAALLRQLDARLVPGTNGSGPSIILVMPGVGAD